MKITYINQMKRYHDNAQSRFMERESEMKQKHKVMFECIFRYTLICQIPFYYRYE